MKAALTVALLAVGLSSPAQLHAQEHVAPAPPQLEMHDMPYPEMARVMGMDDRQLSGHIVVDQLEWTSTDGQDGASWDAHAWIGRDEGKLWLKAEGESTAGSTSDAEIELAYDRYVSRWWSMQAGARRQYGEGPSRDWLAVGLHGLSPYFFDVSAMAYLGEGGRAAFRLKSTYEMLFTQRLILQPFLEANLHSESDPERLVGSGLSDIQLGLRLRYEIHRQFAPYIGISFNKTFGDTGDLVRQAGGDASETQFVAGIRLWL